MEIDLLGRISNGEAGIIAQVISLSQRGRLVGERLVQGNAATDLKYYVIDK